MSQQNPLTIIVAIDINKMEQLRKLLDELRTASKKGETSPLANMGTIHYCRWVIMETVEEGGKVYPARLLFSSNFDGDTNQHIKDLCSSMQAGFIDKIYECCEGYPVAASRNPESKADFFKRGKIKTLAFYKGAPERSVQRIIREHELKNELNQILNAGDWKNQTAIQIHNTLRKLISHHPSFEWTENAAKIPAKNWLLLIPFFLLLVPLLVFIIPVILILNIFYEPYDKPLNLLPSQVSGEHISHLETYEDFVFQNQFTQVLTMKAGFLRLITLKFILYVVNILAKILFVKNNLMGIPTIHYARWVMMDNNKRMLFLSNFDGSWQQYLGDFIDKSGWGLSAIWSNTQGFPRTIFYFKGGAYDEEHFLAWARYNQIPTQLWYAAYPNLSIKNIVNNSHIRVELMKDLDEEGSKRFLKRL